MINIDFKKWSLVGLTEFSDNKMTGRLVGTKKMVIINEVVVRQGSTVYDFVIEKQHKDKHTI